MTNAQRVFHTGSSASGKTLHGGMDSKAFSVGNPCFNFRSGCVSELQVGASYHHIRPVN